MKRIIIAIVSTLAALVMGFAAVFIYEKGLTAVKAEIASRWAHAKNSLGDWFRTSKPETT